MSEVNEKAKVLVQDLIILIRERIKQEKDFLKKLN